MTDQDKNFNYAALINREMEILDYKSMMKQKFKEGFEIGLKEAREEGLEEGIVHGEKKAEIRILRNMIANGYKTDEALRIMGIPEAQWEALKVKLK
jgi:flagellar biosynthesis/type III secretory pathway protein FliH